MCDKRIMGEDKVIILGKEIDKEIFSQFVRMGKKKSGYIGKKY